MSTAYPPRLIKYAFSSKKERNAATASASSMRAGEFGQFPNSFVLYYAGPGGDFLSQRFYFRENNEERKKLYAISYFKGPGTTNMTLYATPSHAPPTLAISASESRFGSSITVTVPPPPSSSSSLSASGSQTLQVKYTLRGKAHGFTLPVGSRGARGSDNLASEKIGSDEDSSIDKLSESFEWREEGASKPRIRRLVRLPRSAGPGGGTEELVATWREGTVPNWEGRLALFEFSSPASQEKLGSYGTLVAVSTVLAICGIMGAAIDGAASWQQEKALEKGYFDGYWLEEEGEGKAEAARRRGGPWEDPWMKHGKVEEDH